MDRSEIAICDLFERLCFKDYPVECIVFSYCSERIAALKPKAEIDVIEPLFPDGVDATRFLRSHSSLGSEILALAQIANLSQAAVIGAN